MSLQIQKVSQVKGQAIALEYVTVLVHGSPQILSAAVERHEEFVDMPRVSLLTAPPPKRAGVVPAECQAPLTDGFVGDRHAPLGQQVLNIPEAERESVSRATRRD